jgi:ubiquinone/menaquinone biosynthesis C-methylase UbiE
MAKIYSNVVKTYHGCDISDLAILKATDLNLTNCQFLCCDAHELPYQDHSFDVVIVSSLLHHLDLRRALSEINRVLKFGGRMIFREPLGINPIFTIYRLLTPNVRTPDERPFTISDIKEIHKYFNVLDSNYFGFLVLIESYVSLPVVFKVLLERLDRFFSSTWLKYFYWQWSGVGVKK